VRREGKLTSLQPVIQPRGRKLYCGPTAICAVTRRHPLEVLAAVRRYRGWDASNEIVGMDNFELVGVLASLGWAAQVWLGPQSPQGWPITFWRYVHAYEPVEVPTILALSHHFVTIDATHVLCNQTGGVPVPLSEERLHRRRHVQYIFGTWPMRGRAPGRRCRDTLSPVPTT
jgi:hypothetical protein